MGTTSKTLLAVLCTVLVVTTVCAQRAQTQPPRMHPADAFREFENKLTSLRDYSMTFSVATEGAVSSKIEGTLQVRGTRLDLTAQGTYGREPITVSMRFDGRQVTGGTRRAIFEVEAPEDFYIYFVQAMTRLGLIHNLMRMLHGEPPEFPVDEEEAKAWIEITYISTGERRFVGNVEAFPFGMRYRLFGEDVGEGRLWINVASGLPFRREAAVRVNGETLNVVEFYGYSR